VPGCFRPTPAAFDAIWTPRDPGASDRSPDGHDPSARWRNLLGSPTARLRFASTASAHACALPSSSHEARHQHRRPALRQGHEPPAARAHPRHPDGAQGEPGRARAGARGHAWHGLLPRSHVAPARPHRARGRDAGPRRGRAPLQGEVPARGQRRGLGEGPAHRQAGGRRLVAADDRRLRARLRAAGGFDHQRRGPHPPVDEARRQGLAAAGQGVQAPLRAGAAHRSDVARAPRRPRRPTRPTRSTWAS
jgi:hypothetical protein